MKALTQLIAFLMLAASLSASAVELPLAGLGTTPVEFHEGTLIPVTLNLSGDLVRSVDAKPTSFVKVARTFWVKRENDVVSLSLDGAHYRPFHDVIRGELGVGATADDSTGQVSAMQVTVSAALK